MTHYLTIIKRSQKILLTVSIVIMLVLPLTIVFFPDALDEHTVERLFDLSHVAIFFVMVVRPLADIFLHTRWIRPLVILRKGLGVLSASIPASFIFAKLMADGGAYLAGMANGAYWSLAHFALLAHLADISALLLLLTSNTLSKKVLGKGWKRIHRLSYVYFYASSFYVLLALHATHLWYSLAIVTLLTIVAYLKNSTRRAHETSTLHSI